MTPGQERARRAAWWIAPPLLCLAVYWRAFTAWFRADDFAWLGGALDVHSAADLLRALFAPLAQGTIRPLSERVFFMAGFALFGLDALPFRIVVFATQFASLALVAAIGTRLTGRRSAGFAAATLWLIHGSMILPLGWTCVYNQVLCGFFLLLAFYFLLRWIETAQPRFELYQWIAFLLGFGALELNLVYPALAAIYTYLFARKYFRRTLPMFAVSAAFVAIHAVASSVPKTGEYAMHFTGSMLRTLATYWTWSLGPTFLWMPVLLPNWLLPAGVAVVTIALAAVVLRSREWRLAVFCLAWYVIALVPVLPLRDHLTEYYPYLPRIGLCWLAGWALVAAWRGSAALKAAAATVVAIYAAMVLPQVYFSTDWNYRVSQRVRNLVEGVAAAHDQHPQQALLLYGVDNDLFWNGVLDRPFRLFGADHVYLAPGSEKKIEAHADLGRVEEYILPAEVAAKAIERDELVVYDVAGPRLRNITAIYADLPRDNRAPMRIDAASPLVAYLLGPEWYPVEGDHRWMPKRATFRIGAPQAASQKLYVRGACPDAQLANGPVTLTVTVEGTQLPSAVIRESAFEIALSLPATLVGKPEMSVTLEVDRVLHPAADPRDLGLVFGSFEVR